MGGQKKRTVDSLPLTGKTVLVRADLDVPIVRGVADASLLSQAVPTIRYLLDKRCKVVVIGHLSRPDGRDAEFSLQPIAQAFANLLRTPVRFTDTAIGIRAAMAVKRAPRGAVMVLENLRFYKGEEANDAEFARELAKASGAQYFVQDDSRAVKSTAASTVKITNYLPSVAGLALKNASGPGVKSLLDA